MKLSTKKLFTHSKNIKKRNLISNKNIINSSKTIVNPKLSEKLISPFMKSKNKYNKIKNKEKRKFEQKINKIEIKSKIDNSPDFIDNDITERNSFILTAETETNRYYHEEKIKVTDFFETSKKSELKSFSTIDNDNFGNNNINKKQEKNINKSKINSIKIEIYHNNDILQIQKNNLVKFDLKRIQFRNFGRKILSVKENLNNLKIRDLLEIKDEIKKNNDESNEDNSLFENFYNKSNDSSFLDSSFREDIANNFLES